MKSKHVTFSFLFICLAIFLIGSQAMAADPIKIGIIQGLSGPYEIYGKAEVTGFKMGLEYFTKGTNKLIGCLLYTSPSPRDRQRSRMPSSA